MSFEYQLWCIPVDAPAEMPNDEFIVLEDGRWISFEEIVYLMNDPMSGDENDGITWKIIRRYKK